MSANDRKKRMLKALEAAEKGVVEKPLKELLSNKLPNSSSDSKPTIIPDNKSSVDPHEDTVFSKPDINLPPAASVVGSEKQEESGSKPAEDPQGTSMTVNGLPPKQEGNHVTVPASDVIGGFNEYMRHFFAPKQVLHDLMEDGYFSEWGLEKVEVNFIVESDGTLGIEVVYPKDMVEDSPYSVEKIIRDRLRKYFFKEGNLSHPVRIEDPPEDDIKIPHRLDIPHFMKLGDRIDTRTGKDQTTKVLVSELSRFVNSYNDAIWRAGARKRVKIHLEIKKLGKKGEKVVKNIVVKDIEPECAKQAIGEKLEKMLGAFSAVNKMMRYPKLRDVQWTYEHKITVPENAVKMESFYASSADSGASDPFAGMEPPREAPKTSETKIAKPGVENGKPDTGPQPIVQPIVLSKPKAAEPPEDLTLRDPQADKGKVEKQPEVAPSETEEPQKFRWGTAVATAAAGTGIILAMLPRSVEWLASKVQSLSTLSVPENVQIMDRTISTEQFIPGMAALTAAGAAIIIAIDRARHKRKQKQVTNDENKR